MKSYLIILLFTLNFQVNSQLFECSTGITTELLSASNSMPGYYYQKGWACGVNGVIIKGSGYGNQWVNLTGHGVPTNINLYNISAADSLNAFVCGTSGSNTYVWKTSNGGLNWFQVFIQSNGYINAVYMRNALSGFIEGNPVNSRWSLWRTSNGGINWDSSGLFLPQAGNETGLPNSLLIPFSIDHWSNGDSNKIWFGTNNYRIYYSSNFGQNWITESTPAEQNIFCLDYGKYNPSVLFAGGSNNLLKSTNFGLNWTTISIGGTGNITGIATCAFSFYLTRGNQIFKSDFSGNNWIQTYTAPSGIYRYVDNRENGANGLDHYAVRSNGGITFLMEVEGVKKIGSEIPNSFTLCQNYPNPFNPITKIKFSIPPSPSQMGRGSGGEVKLIIYDILGREVAILVNEKLSPGTYEVEWDASNYPSGVYFYKLTLGDFSQTKKLILIK